MLRITILAIFTGGGLGAVARFASQQLAIRLFGAAFPWGTLAVNIAGGLAMGAITGWYIGHGNPTPWTRLFLTTGVLGGFTTFSAFSLDAVQMIQRGAVLTAAGYSLASVGLSIAAVFLGLGLIKALA